MTSNELSTASSVAYIFFCRMMGLFMVLPVMSLYASSLQGATLPLVGFAVGAYGLSQALLQIPFAMLSDRFGRKNIILIGLGLFFLGSLGASYSSNIWMLILFRFMQGTGAIAGVSMAFLADHSTPSSRSKVMAIVGIAIGSSFILALVIGPAIASGFGLSGVFQLSAFFALSAFIVACVFLRDTARTNDYLRLGYRKKLGNALSDKKVHFYSLSIFVLHASLTSVFLLIPLIFEQRFMIERNDHAWVFLIIFLCSLLLMGPFARPSADLSKLKSIYHFSVSMMALVLLGMGFSFSEKYFFLTLLCLFFTSFNLMEALLPAMLSIEIDEEQRATAMGVYSSSQFLGAFAGGVLSGWIGDAFGFGEVFILCGCVFALLSFFFLKARSGLLNKSTSADFE